MNNNKIIIVTIIIIIIIFFRMNCNDNVIVFTLYWTGRVL